MTTLGQVSPAHRATSVDVDHAGDVAAAVTDVDADSFSHAAPPVTDRGTAELGSAGMDDLCAADSALGVTAIRASSTSSIRSLTSRLLEPGGLDGIAVHRQVLGAGHDEVLHVVEGGSLADAVLARPLLDARLVHPDAPAARSAAQAAVAGARHLDQAAADGSSTRRGASYTPL